MILTNDQLDQYVGNGTEYEWLLHALIRSEAFACDIAPHQIDWDFRPHVGDAGKDVLIRRYCLKTNPFTSSLVRVKSSQFTPINLETIKPLEFLMDCKR
jgi:hypothetical protein